MNSFIQFKLTDYPFKYEQCILKAMSQKISTLIVLIFIILTLKFQY